MILERLLKVNGLNKGQISKLLNTSQPTTLLLLKQPERLRISQVVSIAEACKEDPRNVIDLILGEKKLIVDKADGNVIAN